MRERAKKLLEQATPEQRRQLEQLAREFAENSPQDAGERGGGAGDSADSMPFGNVGNAGRGGATPTRATREATAPTQTVPVDARASTREGRQRTISEIMNNDPSPRSATGQSATLDEAMRNAVEGAQSGIENRSVPNDRTELVRRVFQRYQQRAQEKSGVKQDVERGPAPDAAPAGGGGK
jgi:hypothetical protein